MGGGGPVLGTLHLEVYHPDQTKAHAFVMNGDELPYRMGGMHWGNPTITQYGYLFSADILMAAESELVFNGQTDSGAWWCDSASTKTVLFAVTWNGAWVAPVQNVSNGGSGTNCKVVASAPSCPANDKDCDGYAVNDPNQSLKDCNDATPAVKPNQLETWGDAVDTNCNGFVDPPSWKYAVTGLGQGLQMQLVDGNSWSNGDFTKTYAMTFASNAYSATVSSWVAPTNIVVRYRLSTNDPWLWTTSKVNGSCVAHQTHQVSETHYNTLIPFGFEPTWCHLVKQ